MKKIISIFLFIIVLFISCGEKKNESKKISNTLSVSDVWMRPGVKNRNSAAFLKISNGTNKADTLFSVTSNLGKVIEIHETYTKENDMKGMRHVENIIIEANSIVELKPGSFHIMLIGLNNNLPIGNRGKLLLNFRNAGSIEIEAEVR